MEKAFDVLLNQGVLGALLVLFLIAIVSLQNKRDKESDGRLKDARELLTTIAEVNRALTALRDSVGGVAQSLTSLIVTVQSIHADTNAHREANRERDRRVEATIEDSRRLVKSIEESASLAAETTIKNNKILKDLHERGTE